MSEEIDEVYKDPEFWAPYLEDIKDYMDDREDYNKVTNIEDEEVNKEKAAIQKLTKDFNISLPVTSKDTRSLIKLATQFKDLTLAIVNKLKDIGAFTSPKLVARAAQEYYISVDIKGACALRDVYRWKKLAVGEAVIAVFIEDYNMGFFTPYKIAFDQMLAYFVDLNEFKDFNFFKKDKMLAIAESILVSVPKIWNKSKINDKIMQKVEYILKSSDIPADISQLLEKFRGLEILESSEEIKEAIVDEGVKQPHKEEKKSRKIPTCSTTEKKPSDKSGKLAEQDKKQPKESKQKEEKKEEDKISLMDEIPIESEENIEAVEITKSKSETVVVAEVSSKVFIESIKISLSEVNHTSFVHIRQPALRKSSNSEPLLDISEKKQEHKSEQNERQKKEPTSPPTFPASAKPKEIKKSQNTETQEDSNEVKSPKKDLVKSPRKEEKKSISKEEVKSPRKEKPKSPPKDHTQFEKQKHDPLLQEKELLKSSRVIPHFKPPIIEQEHVQFHKPKKTREQFLKKFPAVEADSHYLNYLYRGPSEQDCHGYVYIYYNEAEVTQMHKQFDDISLFKVGRSQDLPERRIKTQEKYNRESYIVKQSFECVFHKLLESLAHVKLRDCRVRRDVEDGGTEWFTTNFRVIKDAVTNAKIHIDALYG